MSDQLNQVVEAIEKKQSEIDAMLKSAGTESKAAVEAAEKAAKELKAMGDRLLEIEQKQAEGIKKGYEMPKSLGESFATSEEFKAFAEGRTSKARLEIKNTITGQSGSPAANSDTIVAPQRQLGIVAGAFRTLRIRDVMPSGTTSSNLVEYTRELAFTNAAAETAEGATKPEATLTFELVSAPVKTIAHWLKLSKQVMDDAPALASYVDTRLRYGVDLRIDQQLLNGNGSGQNIGGLAKVGNHTAFTPSSGDNAIDSINRAIYAVAAADYNATAIILNPADWGAIERTKTTDDAYVFGAPQRLAPTLWGLPVVATNTMTQGKFMVGAFDMAAQVWNRQGTVVEMSESDDTNFQKNLVTVRAEARLALAIYRPVSIQYGSLVA
jgi:HK97 family phage major capsid protein